MIYLGITFGHPLAFVDAVAAWNGHPSLGSRLIAALTLQPLWRPRFADFSVAGMDQWFFILFLVLTGVAWKQISSTLGLFIGISAPETPPFRAGRKARSFAPRRSA